MRNIRLTLAYDGTNYVGWQVQPNGISVQEVVELAVERFTGERVRVLSAGRTDSGVHAMGQVVNFRIHSPIPIPGFLYGLQNLLPNDIVIRDAEEVPLQFHATYSARWKRYRYVIHNSRFAVPFLRNYVYRHSAELDARHMHAAAQILVGRHDFRAFETQFPNTASSVRTVMEIQVDRYAGWPLWTQSGSLRHPPADNGEFICLDIVADGFLYNMVRSITGTLIHVGRGRWMADDVARILQTGLRAQAGETAPAQGLYLIAVGYEEFVFGSASNATVTPPLTADEMMSEKCDDHRH